MLADHAAHSIGTSPECTREATAANGSSGFARREPSSRALREHYHVCGICGIAFFHHVPADAELVPRMNGVLRHRGPDAAGYYHGPGIALGHRRLSVIDVEGGPQPWSDAQGRITAVYNGEIYNFQELRHELQAAGAQFRSRCDTEVLVEGFRIWGTELWPKLHGMFAFALWDAAHDELWLVRDRFGVKPLYWTQLTDGGLAFASELTALLQLPQISPRLDPHQLLRYLSLSYVPGEASLVRGVQRLIPGSQLHWRRSGGFQITRWYDLKSRWESGGEPPAADEVLPRFEALLRNAVQSRLVSDVPLGTLLSGGLDSSVVTTLAAQAQPRLPAFTIGFAADSYDETPYASQVAAHLGCEHHVQRLDEVEPDLLRTISDLQDEPFADTSLVPTFLLCRLARRHVTVALSGDGGDELLAGYITHRATAWHARAAHLPHRLRQGLATMAELLPDSRRKVNLLFQLKQFARGLPLPPGEAHASWRMLARGRQLADLLVPADAYDPDQLFAPYRHLWQEAPRGQLLDRALWLDYATWLPDDILVKTDRASMANSLEVRSPFLDHRLVEFCMRLPASWKRRGSRGKILLKQLAEKYLPREVVYRRKAGFNAPVSHWLSGPWRELVTATLAKPSSFLDSARVQRLWREHQQGSRDHGMLLFNLVMLQLWCQRTGASV